VDDRFGHGFPPQADPERYGNIASISTSAGREKFPIARSAEPILSRARCPHQPKKCQKTPVHERCPIGTWHDDSSITYLGIRCQEVNRLVMTAGQNVVGRRKPVGGGRWPKSASRWQSLRPYLRHGQAPALQTPRLPRPAADRRAPAPSHARRQSRDRLSLAALPFLRQDTGSLVPDVI
jgi:hypothetical protein